MLRHSFAVHTLRWLTRTQLATVAKLMGASGADPAWALALRSQDPLLMLRDLLGHASVSTTEVYLGSGRHRPAVHRRRARRRRGELMTTVFVEVPLGLDLDFPGYDRCRLDLSALPCRALACELATAMLERTNTGGPIRSPSTAKNYRTAISAAARWFHAQGFDGDARHLTEELVFDYWRRCGARQESMIRILLGHIEQRHPGRLAPSLVRHLSGIPLNPRPEARPRQPYSAGETQRLLTACTTMIETAEAAMAAAAALAGAGADPATAGLNDRANLAWLLDRHGPHTTATLARRLDGTEWRVARAVSFTLPELHDALFPTNEVALAFRLLLGLQTGICPEGADNLTAGCVEWIGATDARISWFKARGGGRQNQVFASRGRWSPGRVVERWLAYTDGPAFTTILMRRILSLYFVGSGTWPNNHLRTVKLRSTDTRRMNDTTAMASNNVQYEPCTIRNADRAVAAQMTASPHNTHLTT